MASLEKVKIQIEKALVDEIRWLYEYKSAADEALSRVLENYGTLSDSDKDLVLRALNVGAENSEPVNCVICEHPYHTDVCRVDGCGCEYVAKE